MKKLEVLTNIKSANGSIWGKGLVFDESKGQTIPPELLHEAERIPKIVTVTTLQAVERPEKKNQAVEKPEEKKIVEQVETEVLPVTFETKGQIRQAKKDDLIAYLKLAGESTEGLSRDALIEKAIKVLEGSDI